MTEENSSNNNSVDLEGGTAGTSREGSTGPASTAIFNVAQPAVLPLDLSLNRGPSPPVAESVVNILMDSPSPFHSLLSERRGSGRSLSLNDIGLTVERVAESLISQPLNETNTSNNENEGPPYVRDSDDVPPLSSFSFSDEYNAIAISSDSSPTEDALVTETSAQNVTLVSLLPESQQDGPGYVREDSNIEDARGQISDPQNVINFIDQAQVRQKKVTCPDTGESLETDPNVLVDGINRVLSYLGEISADDGQVKYSLMSSLDDLLAEYKKKNVMKFTPGSRYRTPSYIQINGAGGTASWLIPKLIKIFDDAVDKREDPTLITIVICDGDHVEAKNLVRQNFTLSDVGKNKAQVLAQRYSNSIRNKGNIILSYSPFYSYYSERRKVQLKKDLSSEDFSLWADGSKAFKYYSHRNKLTLMINLVDNHKSRSDIHAYCFSYAINCLDVGNDLYNGQALFSLYSLSNIFAARHSLPERIDWALIADNFYYNRFPEEAGLQEDVSLHSCADHDTENVEQMLGINDLAATVAANMINGIYEKGRVSGLYATFVSGSNMRVKVESSLYCASQAVEAFDDNSLGLAVFLCFLDYYNLHNGSSPVSIADMSRCDFSTPELRYQLGLTYRNLRASVRDDSVDYSSRISAASERTSSD